MNDKFGTSNEGDNSVTYCNLQLSFLNEPEVSGPKKTPHPLSRACRVQPIAFISFSPDPTPQSKLLV